MNRDAQLTAAQPTVFRYDYPEAAIGTWAVFWEVDDEAAFAECGGKPEDPTEVASEWIAMSKDEVVDIDSMQ